MGNILDKFVFAGADMTLDSSDLFCYDLPSKPQPEMGKILVTGATGYIGGRLVPELLARGYNVRVMVREAVPSYEERWPSAEIVEANALDAERVDSCCYAITGEKGVYSFCAYNNLYR